MTSASHPSRTVSMGWLVVAALLIGFGFLLALGYNDMAILPFAGAVVSIVLAFRRHRVQAFLAVVVVICCIGVWATLGGGANPFTAIPWGVVGVGALAGIVATSWRRPHG